MSRRPVRDEGFSLVELLVIVAIIGVLALIAISTYINQSRKAERAAAVSTLSNMRLAAESIRADESSTGFSSVPADYEASQSAYEYVGAVEASTGTGVVSVGGPGAPGTGDWVSFAVLGRDRCYYLRVEVDEPTLFQSTADVTGSVDCSASEFAEGAGLGTGSWG